MEYLAQDLMLLALNSQTGSIRFSTRSALPISLMGAVLLDLVLLGKLAIDDKLIVVDASTTGDDFLDQRLNEVLKAPRARTVKFWVGRWSRTCSGFKKVVLQNLVELGVLTQQGHRRLWIFPVQRYFLTDTLIRQAIANQVRAAVLEDVGLDSLMAALISLARACQLTSDYHSKHLGGCHTILPSTIKGCLFIGFRLSLNALEQWSKRLYSFLSS